jgi:hypothetical protein
VYAVESPTGAIVSYDVTVPTPPRAPLAAAGATSGTPVALVVGHTGNLFVASAGTGAVEEIDIVTGAPAGTLLAAGGAPPVGLAFDPGRRSYLLLTAEDEVIEIDRHGAVVDTHVSDLVAGATAITFLGR